MQTENKFTHPIILFDDIDTAIELLKKVRDEKIKSLSKISVDTGSKDYEILNMIKNAIEMLMESNRLLPDTQNPKFF